MKTLTAKNLSDTYRACKCDEQTWNTFLTMRRLGFIDESTWTKFYDLCHNIMWDDELGIICTD